MFFPLDNSFQAASLYSAINNTKETEVERSAGFQQRDVVDEQLKIALDDLIGLAASLCDVPMAMIALVDSDRQWFVSRIGPDVKQQSIDSGWRPLTITQPHHNTTAQPQPLTRSQPQPLIIPDAAADPEQALNPMLNALDVRFYAEFPLIAQEGQVLGSLCVMDVAPGELSSSQREGLEAIARQVVNQLSLRLAVQQVEDSTRLLTAVSCGVAVEIGDNFFSALVQQLTKALNVDYAYIALRSKNTPGQMETIAVCHKGKVMSNFKYPLRGFPCEDIMSKKTFCYYEKDIQSLYPEAACLSKPAKAESYAAMPILNSVGEPLGVLALVDTKPLLPTTLVESLLTIFSVRIATELERQQDEIRQTELLYQAEAARLEAEIANQMKDDFLAVVSHELRSPLNPIVGWASILRQSHASGQLSEERMKKALEAIERNALLQVKLIDDLLDVSHVLHGKLSLTRSPVPLASAVTAGIEAVEEKANKKSIAIQTTGLQTSHQVMGDFTRLRQIVQNILSNAVKFTPAGGKISVSLTTQAGNAVLQIRDNGRGISADFLPYVFDRFRQEDYSTTREFGGLGLGLTLVRQLATMHGGTVNAQSDGSGQGAIVELTLPLLNTHKTDEHL